ncbi:MAG: hypothetical protein ACO1OT_08490 [Heyndrickxia sp.]
MKRKLRINGNVQGLNVTDVAKITDKRYRSRAECDRCSKNNGQTVTFKGSM